MAVVDPSVGGGSRVGFGLVQYSAPRSLAEALEVIAAEEQVVLAGGTDFYPAHVDRAIDFPVTDITGVEDMRGIAVAADHVRIGALTTWSQIAAANLPDGCRALQQAAVEVGGVQIQNVGTIGGNLCNSSPAADGVPPLLAVDASVELASISETRILPLDEFFVGYRQTALRSDELLTAVLVPTEGTRGRSAFLKLGSRRYLVISIAMAAARLEITPEGAVHQARIVVGACTPIAHRLVGLEADLRGVEAAAASDVVDKHHLEGLSPIDDPRAPASYRLTAAATLVARTLDSCVEAA